MDDHSKIDPTLEVAKDVRAYTHFRSMKKLGINIGVNDLTFERAMLFSWIEENLDG